MKVSETTQFYLPYQKANAKSNSLKNYKYVLCKFNDSFGERKIDTITTEEIISFLTRLTKNNKQNTVDIQLFLLFSNLFLTRSSLV